MIFGLVIFLLYLYFFVGFNEILLVVEHANLMEYAVFLSLAICAFLLVMLFWVASWKTLLNSLSIKVSFKNAFLYYWVGYFSDLVIPGQGVVGEAARMYLVRKETKDDYGAIAACGVTNRTVAYTVVTAGLSIGLVYLMTTSMFAQLPAYVLYILLIAWIGSVIHVGALLYLALSDGAVKRIADLIFKVLKVFRLKKYTSEENMQKTYESLARFHEGSRFFRKNPRQLILPFCFQILSYILSITVYFLILSTLGVTSGFIEFFILVYFLAGAIQDASAVFSVGALEIILTIVFMFYHFEPALSGVAVAMLRSVTFWFPVVVGYIIIQVVGAKNILTSRVRAGIPAGQKGGADKTPRSSTKATPGSGELNG
jgi:uncharacterized protein (TIRG00374 family)